jgi:hypothetical protein
MLIGVSYRKPAWIGLAENVSVLSVGAALEGVACLVGAPWLGLVFGAGAVLLFGVAYGNEVLVPTSLLVFESNGMRVGFGEGTFVVSWSNVVSAETKESEPYQVVAVTLRDNWLLIETVHPNTELMRARISGLFSEPNREGKLVLPAWIGGLDAAKLVAEINMRVQKGGRK